jgi:hypothetical protein
MISVRRYVIFFFFRPNTEAAAQAINRVYEKRSLFGSKSMKVVDDFFRHQDFIGNTKKISEYAKWATRFNGPAIWKTPTPMKIVCSPKSKDYIVCFLQSYSFFLSADFVLETTRHV